MKTTRITLHGCMVRYANQLKSREKDISNGFSNLAITLLPTIENGYFKELPSGSLLIFSKKESEKQKAKNTERVYIIYGCNEAVPA